MQLPKMQMPDISDFMANMFGGKPTKKPKKAITGSTPGPKRVAR